jgi:hypothetical protein
MFQSEVVRGEQEFTHKSEKLENKLMNIVKKMYKLKGIIEDLKRNVDLDLFLSKNLIDHYNDPNTPTNIFIRVENYEEGNVYYWTQNIFHDRYDALKELYNKFLDEGYDLSTLKKEDDPLFDQPKQSLLGYAFYKLEPLAYLMNNCTNIPIISVNGETEGTITIDVIPVDEKGELYEEIPEKPMDLIGQNLHYYVHIKEVKDLPENFSKGLQVEYTSFNDNYTYKTKTYNEEGKETSFTIDEKFEHKILYLSEEDINFFLKDKICFKIYAYEEIQKKGKKGVPNRDEILRAQGKLEENEEDKADAGDNAPPEEKKRAKTMTRFKTTGNVRKGDKSSKNAGENKDCVIY